MRRLVTPALVLALGGCNWAFGLESIPIPPDGDWVSVAGNGDMTCGIREGGALYCWGLNRHGQVGAGIAAPEVTAPARVVPTTLWKEVAVASNNACAIAEDDSLWCWGTNSEGQLGVGGGPGGSSPIRVGTEVGWSRLASGGDSSCAMRDTALFCWGRNEDGQVGSDEGLDANTDALSPVLVGTQTWASVTAGRRHTCALDLDGHRWCWGNNSAGELGLGDMAVMRRAPMLAPDATTWSSLSAGEQVTCGITTENALQCWGENRAGQLGDGSDMPARATPLPVAVEGVTWNSVYTSARYACAIDDKGHTWCWGDLEPMLGIPSTRVPVQLPDDIRATALAAGRTHLCRLTYDRALFCAGNGSSGALADGVGTTTSPSKLDGLWSSVDAGGQQTCAVRSDGRLACWGDNQYGALGDGTHDRRIVPTEVPGGTWSEIQGGEEHTCGIRDGSVACWGTDASGSLGDGTLNRSPKPVAVATTLVLSRLTVSDHACAIDSLGQVACWGRNTSSQQTSTNMAPVTSPTKLPLVEGQTHIAVASGSEHTCLVATNHRVYCVGSNSFGQLANGTMSPPQTALVKTNDASLVKAVVSGWHHSCSITDAGLARCWGRNTDGQCGSGTTAHLTTPAPVVGDRMWLQLALGETHTCGVDVAKRLWCWGSNARGQLGDGTLERHLTPVQVGIDADWAQVTVGRAHTCARKDDQSLWCWGDNRDGALGTRAGWRPTFELVPLPD